MTNAEAIEQGIEILARHEGEPVVLIPTEVAHRLAALASYRFGDRHSADHQVMGLNDFRFTLLYAQKAVMGQITKALES